MQHASLGVTIIDSLEKPILFFMHTHTGTKVMKICGMYARADSCAICSCTRIELFNYASIQGCLLS